MKQLKLQLNRLNAVQISVFLLIFGLFLGILCANLFKENYIGQIEKFESDLFSKIVTNDIDYAGFFRYILFKNFGNFIIFWLLCVTILGLPYMAFKITSFGFFAGFFISAVTMEYGMKGMLLVMVYVFPHGLIYLPVELISLYKGFELCRTIYHDNRTNITGISRLLKSYLLIILLLALALLLASFLEAYPGAFLLKKTLGLFT